MANAMKASSELAHWKPRSVPIISNMINLFKDGQGCLNLLSYICTPNNLGVAVSKCFSRVEN